MAMTCVIATTTTHLTMHFVLPRFFETHWRLAGELGAFAVEAAAYATVARSTSVQRALIASFFANSASYLAGRFLF